MTNAASTPVQILDSTSELRQIWLPFIALGVALLALGTVASLNLFLATIASVYFIGAMMLLGGIFQLGQAFIVRGWRPITFWSLSGLLYFLAGVSVFTSPFFAAALLTIVLAISLGLSGLLRLLTAFRSDIRGKGWIALSGLASLAMAAIIGVGWPSNSSWMLGLILAIDLMFQGVALIFAGFSVRLGAAPDQVKNTRTLNA